MITVSVITVVSLCLACFSLGFAIANLLHVGGRR